MKIAITAIATILITLFVMDLFHHTPSNDNYKVVFISLKGDTVKTSAAVRNGENVVSGDQLIFAKIGWKAGIWAQGTYNQMMDPFTWREKKDSKQTFKEELVTLISLEKIKR